MIKGGDIEAAVTTVIDSFGGFTILSNDAGSGAALNFSTISAKIKNQRMATYSSSKAAISDLTRNIAFDLVPKGNRVNGIAPARSGLVCPPGKWSSTRDGLRVLW